jgi:bifunctional non-homologous end joining protein LigD
VQLSTYDLNGSRVFLGNVTIPADKGIPQVGDFVDIEYLYAFKGGSLFQPVYKGKRNDVEADTYDQVKFKADGDRDEEDDVPAPDDPCAGDRISLHT